MFEWPAELVHVVLHRVVGQGRFSAWEEIKGFEKDTPTPPILHYALRYHGPTLHELIDVHLHQLTDQRHGSRFSVTETPRDVIWEQLEAAQHLHSRQSSGTHKISSCSWMMLACGLSLFMAWTSRRLYACSRLNDRKHNPIYWIEKVKKKDVKGVWL